MSAYNIKVNIDGSYRPFFGYTVVAMLETDLSFVEFYIKNNKILANYFSPLPFVSYHMTVFNIWCPSKKLLPIQNAWLIGAENNFIQSQIDPLPYNQTYSFFKEEYLKCASGQNLCGFINDDLFVGLMSKVSTICIRKEFTGKIMAESSVSGLKLGVVLDEKSQVQWNKQRSLIAPIVGHKDRNLSPHITLAYRYKDIPSDKLYEVQEELEKLNSFMSSKITNDLKFSAPLSNWFTDMTNYMSSNPNHF